MEMPVLKAITTVTKDGEWGKGESFDSSLAMTVIRGTDFADARVGILENAPTRHIPEHIAIRKRLQSLDILIETAGGTKDQPTGRTLLVKPSLLSKSALPLTCASFARFIRIDQNKADPAFVFWLLQSLYNCGAIRQYHTQHTGVARFQFTTFAEREPLPLPSIVVQKQIASILSAYDDLIENNTRRIRILEDMAQMLYREWFVNFRFPDHENVQMVDSELGSIPEGWTVRPLAEIYRTGSGGTPSRKVPSYFGGTIRWVKTQELLDCFIQDTDEKITEEGLKNSSAKLYPEGTVLMAMYGATIGKLGVLATEATCNQASCAMLPKAPGFGPEFLYLTLLTRRTDILALRMGAAQQNISQEVIKAFPILRPETSVITAFTDKVTSIFRLIAVLQAKNRNLRTTRDLLLPKLISGEIPVGAADETAVELTEEIAQPA